MATDQLNFQVTLRDERDKLLAEKASAPTVSADGAASGAGDATESKQKFEAEKAELIKARDDALARSKVRMKSLRKERCAQYFQSSAMLSLRRMGK